LTVEATRDLTVSVVIPTYNRCDRLARAVDSALGQSRPPLEVLVVDDGSTDATVAMLDERTDSRLRVLRHERNLGGAAARNTGIREARGSWIAFLDSDDTWAVDKLRSQVDLLEADRALDGVFCAFARVDPAGARREVRLPEGMDLRAALSRRRFVITLSTFLVRRQLLVERGLFDESLPAYQDTDVYLRLLDRARIGYLPECLVTQAVGDADRITGNVDARLRGYRVLIRRHRALLATDRLGLAEHWMEIGKLARLAGERSEARRAILRAIGCNPLRGRAYARLLELYGGGTLVRITRRWRNRGDGS